MRKTIIKAHVLTKCFSILVSLSDCASAALIYLWRRERGLSLHILLGHARRSVEPIAAPCVERIRIKIHFIKSIRAEVITFQGQTKAGIQAEEPCEYRTFHHSSTPLYHLGPIFMFDKMAVSDFKSAVSNATKFAPFDIVLKTSASQSRECGARRNSDFDRTGFFTAANAFVLFWKGHSMCPGKDHQGNDQRAQLKYTSTNGAR